MTNRYNFEKLTPTEDVDLNVYEEAINFVFENPDIKNIAISGAYSAGKSSVLASYKKKNTNKKFMHISLAHFESPNRKEEVDMKESILEGKILNQLIHQISSNKIPQTNFRVKKKIYLKDMMITTLLIILFLLSALHFIFFGSWNNYVSNLPDCLIKSILSLSIQPSFLIISSFTFFVVMVILIFKLIKIQKNKNIFRKLNIQGSEIEIFEESDDSYFDKYLNEVLYLFENTDVDVVVFEDMDRFNVNRIFERLREVNTLVNIQLKKENKKPLRFFYLLRDDIFVSKDRTKFFDYIIPIVPVIDGSNSYDQFISLFKNNALFEQFDKSFLQGLSLYIDDMRLLKNIYNEFLVYFYRLNTTELDYNKMLAIIAYKNLFPRDFCDLQLNRGFVFEIFNQKYTFIKNEINRRQEKISEYSSQIQRIEKEHLNSIHELTIVFAEKHLPYRWTEYRDEYLLKDIFDRINQSERNKYDERKKAIENILEKNKMLLGNNLQLQYEAKSKSEQAVLKDIITRENINDIFSITAINEIGACNKFDEIKSSEYFSLLKYLIRNGYIDETYADYMTYFYENSLSRVDKTFLRSITDKKAKAFSYQLKNPALIVSRLRLVDFDQEEILNFDLLKFLLQTPDMKKYLDQFLNQLKETKNYNFIGLFFDLNLETQAFIESLNSIWPEMFHLLLNETTLSIKQIRLYSIYTLYYSNRNTLYGINENNCLTEYISHSADFLKIENPDIDKLIDSFKILNVCFLKIDYDISDKNLLNAVYENSLYEINFENLKMFLYHVLDIKNIDDIIHKNYSLLYAHPNSALASYISEHMDQYIRVYLSSCLESIQDDVIAVLGILNNKNISDEEKKKYIEVLKTTLPTIRRIEDTSLWPFLLKPSLIEDSEINIIDYFCEYKLDENLITFINNSKILDFSKIEAQHEEDEKRKLFESIIGCDTIKNQKYKECLLSLKFYCDKFNNIGISNDHMKILIDENIIKMTSETLIFIRENYPNQVFYFIKTTIDSYVDIIDHDTFSHKELLEILSWNTLDEYKIKLLKLTNEKITVKNIPYSQEVCSYILEHNFMVSDLNYIFSSFDNWNVANQDIIFQYALEYFENLVANVHESSSALKQKLLESNQLEFDQKIELFIAMIPHLEEKQIKEIFLTLDLKEYLKVFESKTRPTFEIKDINEKLLDSLKEKNLIKDYQATSNGLKYKIIRIKPQTKLSNELL